MTDGFLGGGTLTNLTFFGTIRGTTMTQGTFHFGIGFAAIDTLGDGGYMGGFLQFPFVFLFLFQTGAR